MKLIDNFAARYWKTITKVGGKPRTDKKMNPMNKKTAYNSGIFILLVYLNLAAGSLFAASPNSVSPLYSDDLIAAKINALSGHIEFKYTKEVKDYIRRYTKPGRSGSEQILGRIPVYFPVFEEKLNNRQLPAELKVLAIVESHLDVRAYSKAGAAGLWQLIKGTARQYDLSVRNNFDERYSVEASTDAALDYLSDLYNQFDDWTLALAAYNCGPGNIRKAIRRSGGKRGFWQIIKYLPKETRNYVPKFIAISYLLQHYKEYGIEPKMPDKRYFETAEANVYKHLTFSEISAVTGVPMEVIKRMNYEYRKNYIPANTKGYKLTLPKQAIYDLVEYYNNDQIVFSKEHNYDFSKYILRNFSKEVAQELLGTKYKYDIEVLQLRKPHIVTTLNTNVELDKPVMDIEDYNISQFEASFIYHELKPGESIDQIASEYSVKLEDVMRWNNIRYSDPPKTGAIIRIDRQ